MNNVDWSKPIEGMNYEGRWLPAQVEDDASPDDTTRGIRLSNGNYRHVDEDGYAVSGEHEITARNVANSDYIVAVKRMTRAEANSAWLGFDGGLMDWLDSMGIIKPPTPLEQFMSDHPDADRATAELAFTRWGGEG